MNSLQLSAFWLWYRSIDTAAMHRRNIKYVSERLGIRWDTVKEWHDEFRWEDLAREEDQKLAREMEQVVKAEILDTFEDAIRQHKEIAGELYARFRIAIQAGELELKISDLLKLMEFTTNFIFDAQRGLPQNNFLTTVLGMMPPEKRTEFYGALERARDAGIVGPTMESARRN